jgi:hypothetical protein
MKSINPDDFKVIGKDTIVNNSTKLFNKVVMTKGEVDKGAKG